jgi:hypothetical protein
MTRSKNEFEGRRFEEGPSGKFTRLSVFTPDSEYPKATVDYIVKNGHDKRSKVSFPDTVGTVKVDFLKSRDEGKGHAKALMNHLYSLYPNHTIAWGRTLNAASEHLAENASRRHGRTTYY